MITSYQDYRDYLLDVARGNISGAKPITGYGRKTTAGADSGVLWPNGTFVFPSSAGIQMTLSSTSVNDTAGGTGINSVELHYLDANLVEQFETVTLNGTTGVTTTATDIRFVQCMHMNTYGTLKAADGNISAQNAALTETYSYIETGGNRCSSSVRMVPAGKRMIIAAMYGGSISGSAGAATLIEAASPNFGGHDYTADDVFIPIAPAAYQDSSAGLVVPVIDPLTEGQSFGFTFSTDKAATVVGTWFGFLEDV